MFYNHSKESSHYPLPVQVNHFAFMKYKLPNMKTVKHYDCVEQREDMFGIHINMCY